MAEKISLEVPATLNALSIVRIVLGGVGARLDFSLEELDDLYLATDRLFQAALAAEELERLRVSMDVGDGTMRIAAGAFRSHDLRSQVAVTPGGCIDLCTVLRGLLDGVDVEDDDGGFNVVMIKRGAGSAT